DAMDRGPRRVAPIEDERTTRPRCHGVRLLQAGGYTRPSPPREASWVGSASRPEVRPPRSGQTWADWSLRNPRGLAAREKGVYAGTTFGTDAGICDRLSRDVEHGIDGRDVDVGSQFC